MKPGSDEHVEFWAAVQAYTRACGGNPDAVSDERMRAVASLERVLARTPRPVVDPTLVLKSALSMSTSVDALGSAIHGQRYRGRSPYAEEAGRALTELLEAKCVFDRELLRMHEAPSREASRHPTAADYQRMADAGGTTPAEVPYAAAQMSAAIDRTKWGAAEDGILGAALEIADAEDDERVKRYLKAALIHLCGALSTGGAHPSELSRVGALAVIQALLRECSHDREAEWYQFHLNDSPSIGEAAAATEMYLRPDFKPEPMFDVEKP
jgi:hypothetical protein